MADYTQAQLEEMVVGKVEKPRATFYEKAVLDVGASKIAGRRIYNPTIFIQLIQPGITDNISYSAKRADIEEYYDEYEYFMSTRQGSNTSVPIDIIPGLNISHRQELIDIGLQTIDRLANAQTVPHHLEYAKISAMTLNSVLQEQTNASIEENVIEENTFQNNDGSQETFITGKASPVHATRRLDDSDDVCRPIPPTRRRRREEVGPAERVRESRRFNSGNGVAQVTGRIKPAFPSSNWKLSF